MSSGARTESTHKKWSEFTFTERKLAASGLFSERRGCGEVYQTARISKMRQEHAAEVLHRLKWDKELQALKDAP